VNEGGLIDKPGKEVDIYHTCSALSGLALSQEIECERKEDKLEEIDPIYHIKKSKLEEARKYFSS
jgi:protein farnesyltransferase subunit beta